MVDRMAYLLLHDRTGRLEIKINFLGRVSLLHDRTGRLESKCRQFRIFPSLHDRTGRLEIDFF